jgi:pyruvate,orthophosphate dikinase
MTQWVYRFGGDATEGRADMKNQLGGKGVNLAEMASLGLPVPPGFTVTTDVCDHYYKNGQSYPADLKAQVETALSWLEGTMGKRFGDKADPLLVSVRSGARVSMPGMMDTVLNLGLNSETVEGLATASGNPRFAWDSYRRFMQMYGDVVLGVSHHDFEDILQEHKHDNGISADTDITVEGWRDIVAGYEDLVLRSTGKAFPQDVHEQLWGALGAVFKSWQTPRAVTYRRIHSIPESWGTAVTVQSMVFGNMGEDSATGVAFTRDPSTGENYFYGEYLLNAQGEDVVAGIRTPRPLTAKSRQASAPDAPTMQEALPEVFAQLDNVRNILERHYRDMQDIEFTVERGKLYMLQTRNGKRTAAAALKIAVDMVREGLISRDDGLLRLDPMQLDQLLHPTLDPKAVRNVLGRGLPASPGAASGKLVFTADEAEIRAKAGEAVILARTETSPEDIHGMHAAKGILTSRGGMTSHAAVVARGMGRPCVAGCGTLIINEKAGTLTTADMTVNAGDYVTIDGSTGEVMLGEVGTIQPQLSGDFATIMAWADEVRNLGVRANAETPTDAKVARNFGAQGIGLCRTEHMFFDPARIQAVREMIVADNAQARAKALAQLLPAQQADFHELFDIMHGMPVTIRLLDPPLHEFLPQSDKDIAAFSVAANIKETDVRRRLSALHEANPMLGHRGCRLGITFPDIYAMQVRAILQAAIAVSGQRGGDPVKPEIMLPLIATKAEFENLKTLVNEIAADVFAASHKTIPYTVGTMIELPRAALCADEIAASGAEFFSFGTNDLTQTTLGISRDDAGSFMPDYIAKGIWERDPFVTLDQSGVGQLIEIAAQKGRAVQPDLKIGICGEHGGDPDSIGFCEKTGLDYVSCSPYRIPIARLAGAQAALKFGAQKPGKTGTKAAA